MRLKCMFLANWRNLTIKHKLVLYHFIFIKILVLNDSKGFSVPLKFTINLSL